MVHPILPVLRPLLSDNPGGSKVCPTVINNAKHNTYESCDAAVRDSPLDAFSILIPYYELRIPCFTETIPSLLKTIPCFHLLGNFIARY